jgi:hypothetical protein
VSIANHDDASAWKGYWLTVLAVVSGAIAGALAAGTIGLFVGLILAELLHSTFHLSLDHAVTLVSAIVGIPSVVGLTVVAGYVYLRTRDGTAHPRVSETMVVVAVVEVSILVPVLAVEPWGNGGAWDLGPAWAWLLGAIVVGVLARFVAVHLPLRGQGSSTDASPTR